ncbi:MAG TPA: SDR family oxidoreductase [Candidatus Obscuribacterales bacterium]
MARGLSKGFVGIITGASTGIGKAMALQLAKDHKAKLAINARSEVDLEAVAFDIRKAGGEAVTISGDISDESVRGKLVETCKSSFGEIDMLVNNAGFAKPGLMQNLSPGDWRHVFDVNVFAPVELTYALLPDFLSRKQGTIVNIASVAGKLAFPGSVCYASSKFALTGFSEGMAAELGPKGIDVITVCPGLVRTEFFRKNNNSKDITAMAEQGTLEGWVIKHMLSISSEEAADSIIKACERGGCQEIVLTGAGKVIERLTGVCPPAAWWLSRFVPADRGPKPKSTVKT